MVKRKKLCYAAIQCVFPRNYGWNRMRISSYAGTECIVVKGFLSFVIHCEMKFVGMNGFRFPFKMKAPIEKLNPETTNSFLLPYKCVNKRRRLFCESWHLMLNEEEKRPAKLLLVYTAVNYNDRTTPIAFVYTMSLNGIRLNANIDWLR